MFYCHIYVPSLWDRQWWIPPSLVQVRRKGKHQELPALLFLLHRPGWRIRIQNGSRSRSGIKIKDQDQGLKSNQVLTLFGNILFENASVLPGSSHTETSQLIFLTFQSSFLNLCIALVSPSRAAHQLPQPRLSAGFVRLAVAALDWKQHHIITIKRIALVLKGVKIEI